MLTVSVSFIGSSGVCRHEKLSSKPNLLFIANLCNMQNWVQEIQDVHVVPEVAFTGDTTIEFLECDGADSALSAKLLIMELTYLEDTFTPEEAQVCNTMFLTRRKLHLRVYKLS